MTALRVEFRGAPISIEFVSKPRAWRGKLLSGGGRGAEVHAGSFLRARRIVLDSGLAASERDRILAHELFHFVWWKLPNPVRGSWQTLLASEIAARVKGEMGWSAAWRKLELGSHDARLRTRRWREYACEAFCDSAAAALLAIAEHDEIDLPLTARRSRLLWLAANVDGRTLAV